MIGSAIASSRVNWVPFARTRCARRVENVAGAQEGSVEEALLYAQTYGDVWNDAAKKFLEQALAEKPASAAEPAPAPAE